MTGNRTIITAPEYPTELMKSFQEIPPTFSPKGLEGLDTEGVERKLDTMIELMKAGKSPAILK